VDEDEDAFRQLLASYGQPAAAPPPPDLVTRTARRMAASALPQARRPSSAGPVLQWAGLGLLVALLLMGVWVSAAGGPASPLIGGGGAGFGRALLMIQLLLKPLAGTIGSVLVPMAVLGFAAGLSSFWLLRRRGFAPAGAQA
jgi:hypothetical protein